MNDLELVSNAINYINTNKKYFIEQYTLGIKSEKDKTAIFTAGMSGVGKTELAQFLKEQNPNLLHIDTDNIRTFFSKVGYNGQNSHLFQKPASKGFSKLFDHALKHSFSIILDSNLSNLSKAIENIQRLLDKGYKLEIFYLYNQPSVCYKYAMKREVVTNRKVPYEIFTKSNTDSYRTVLELKHLFLDKIVLNYIDKDSDRIYTNIDINELENKLGGYFDTNR